MIIKVQNQGLVAPLGLLHTLIAASADPKISSLRTQADHVMHEINKVTFLDLNFEVRTFQKISHCSRKNINQNLLATTGNSRSSSKRSPRSVQSRSSRCWRRHTRRRRRCQCRALCRSCTSRVSSRRVRETGLLLPFIQVLSSWKFQKQMMKVSSLSEVFTQYFLTKYNNTYFPLEFETLSKIPILHPEHFRPILFRVVIFWLTFEL